jgi:hypothetical protein
MPPNGSFEERGGWVVHHLMADLGLTMEQASGLVGNWAYESSGLSVLQERLPTVPGSKGGAGWAMWTGPRRLAFEDYARKRGLSINADECNYKFAVFELKGSQASFLMQLNATKDLATACKLTHSLYERPSDVLDGSYRSGPDRLKWAQRALAGARAVKAAPQGPTPVVPPGPPPDGAFRDLVGAAVELLQRLLRETGDYDGKIDRLWGPASEQALMSFQRRAAR